MDQKAKAIIDKARGEGRTFITEPEAKEILRAYKVPVSNERLCHSVDEAVRAAREIGFPVVMKIVSPQIVHKTEFRAVKLNVCGTDEVTTVFQDMVERTKKAGYQLIGILVSETLSGQEMIVGSMRDQQFGQMIMLGMGGIFVEVYKDVAYRLAPLEPIDFQEMLAELRGKKLLEGFRGEAKANIEALSQAVVRVSHVLADFQEIAEMDLNPIFVSTNGAIVADARIIIH